MKLIHYEGRLSSRRALWVRSWGTPMPVVVFLVVVGLGLIGLLFVADATLETKTPVVTSGRMGLPEPPPHGKEIQILTSAPAPAPDMTSPAVLGAQPKAEPEPAGNDRSSRPIGERNRSVDRFSIRGQ